jgi:hypothetical protein
MAQKGNAQSAITIKARLDLLPHCYLLLLNGYILLLGLLSENSSGTFELYRLPEDHQFLYLRASESRDPQDCRHYNRVSWITDTTYWNDRQKGNIPRPILVSIADRIRRPCLAP